MTAPFQATPLAQVAYDSDAAALVHFASGAGPRGTPVSVGGALPTGGTAGQVLTKNSSTNGDAGWVASSSEIYPGVYNATASTMAALIQGAAAANSPNSGALNIMLSGDSNNLKPYGNNSGTISEALQDTLNKRYPIYVGSAQPPYPLAFPNNPPNLTASVVLTGAWVAGAVGPFEQMGYSIGAVANAVIKYSAAANNNQPGRIVYLRQPGGGTISVRNFSDGVYGTISTAGTLGWVYSDVAISGLGSIITTGDGPVTMLLMEQQNWLSGSSTPANIRGDRQLGVKVQRFSVAGMKISDLAKNTSAAGSINTMLFMNPHHVLISCANTNDGNQQTSLSSYTTSLTAVVSALRSAGIGVTIEMGIPYATDATNTIKNADYIGVAKGVALTYGASVIDHTAAFGSWTSALAAGLMDNGDGAGVHCSPSGIQLRKSRVAGFFSLFM